MQMVNNDETHTQQVFEIQRRDAFLGETASQRIIKLHRDASFLSFDIKELLLKDSISFAF